MSEVFSYGNTDQGYIKIREMNWGKWKLEHRWVVEQKIGRELTNEEVVHHIDENKTNNDEDNLMLFASNKEHASWHNKLKRTGMTNPMRRQIKERWQIESQ